MSAKFGLHTAGSALTRRSMEPQLQFRALLVINQPEFSLVNNFSSPPLPVHVDLSQSLLEAHAGAISVRRNVSALGLPLTWAWYDWYPNVCLDLSGFLNEQSMQV